MKYRFGDFLLKPAMRALTNNPDYEIGDLTRGAIASLRQASLGSAFRDFSQRGTERAGSPRLGSYDLVLDDLSDNDPGQPRTNGDAKPASPPSEAELWGLFFQKCYDAAVAGCARGEITLEDVMDAEPFLMIGLPSVALFEAVMRTADAHCTGLLLSGGRALQPSDVPPSFAELFGVLMQTAKQVSECNPALNDAERTFVRAFLLVSSADKAVSGNEIEETRQVALRRIFSHLVSVSTQVTRLGFYKQNFADVLESATLAVQASSSSTC
jgi:hypothetical protein